MLYNVGDSFLMIISNNCTKLAIKTTNVIVRKNVRSSGTRTKLYTNQAKMVLSVITEVTAKPMPIEALRFLETPKKIHKPKNLVNTKLLIKTAPMNSVKYSPIKFFQQACFFSFLVPNFESGHNEADQHESSGR